MKVFAYYDMHIYVYIINMALINENYKRKEEKGMEKSLDVIAIGELLIDMAPGEESAQGNMTFEACPGGAPCNVLALLQKAGHKTGFIGKVGDDFLGHMLGETIESLSIDSTGLIYDDQAKTTLAFVHRKKNGDRDFSFYRKPGADMLLREDEIDAAYVTSAKVLHFGTLSMTSEGVRKATQKAIAIAKENGMLISFDPNLREPLWDSLDDAREQILWGMSQCDILKISDNEVEFMTGESDVELGFAKLRTMTSAKVIFMTLGKDGSLACSGGNVVRAEGRPMEQVVDTTGAGDTFMACCLHYILNNPNETMAYTDEQLQYLLRHANDTAAEITQVKGALKVMPEVNW